LSCCYPSKLSFFSDYTSCDYTPRSFCKLS